MPYAYSAFNRLAATSAYQHAPTASSTRPNVFMKTLSLRRGENESLMQIYKIALHTWRSN